MMTHDEMIAVIQHHKNGGKVEFSRKGGMATGEPREWEYTAKPTFNFEDFDYRAKPEPLVLWVRYDNTARLMQVYEHELDLREGTTIKKFAEVTE